MPLSPEDVVRKTFPTVILRRGYDADEVDTFLEEVVSELRRLYIHVDELQVEAGARQSRLSEDETSQRLQREQEQVELVRAERRELVAEMAELQDRYDRTQRAADDAERRRVEAEGAIAALGQGVEESAETTDRKQDQTDADFQAMSEGQSRASQGDDLRCQVEVLQAELERLQRHDRQFRQQMIESVREQLRLLEAEGG